MDRAALDRLLDDVRGGRVRPDDAADRLAAVLPGAPGAESAASADGVAGTPAWRIDHHRALRCGAAEAVLGSAKAPDQLVAIAHEVLRRSDRLLVTRVDA